MARRARSGAARLRPAPVDASIALLFATAGLFEAWLGGLDAPTATRVVAALATTLPLAWRTRAPVAAVAATSGGWAMAVALGLPADDPVVPGLAPLVAVYSLGAHSSRRGLVAGTAAALAAYGVGFGLQSDVTASDVAIMGAAVLAALAVGGAVRVMGFEADVLAAENQALERDRDEAARRAVAQERARIARELHDVVGHSISVMGLQASAVRRLLSPDQERERETLLAVERTGRDAVGEMSRLLGLLRAQADESAADALPTLRRVDDLVADMRRAGLDLELRAEGDLADLPPGRALAAFRILQEALTNALKHAPGASVRAALRRTEIEIEIEVVDDGGEAPAGSSGAGGHGLVGMRERVALYGGTLEAGPRDGRGFAVVARLPVTGA